MISKDPEELARNMAYGMAITAAILVPAVLIFGLFFSCMFCGMCGVLSTPRRPPAGPPVQQPQTVPIDSSPADR